MEQFLKDTNLLIERLEAQLNNFKFTVLEISMPESKKCLVIEFVLNNETHKDYYIQIDFPNEFGNFYVTSGDKFKEDISERTWFKIHTSIIEWVQINLNK